jgi:hypothetical protein
MPQEKDYSFYTSITEDDSDIESIRTFGSSEAVDKIFILN